MGCLAEVYNAVKTFHEAFNHPVGKFPARITEERKVARLSWMQEELDEFKEAKNFTEEVDALVDLIYFAIGTFVEMGLDPSHIFDLVQKANMAKLFPDGKPHYNEQTKVIKPEGWIPPDESIREYLKDIIND